MKIVIGTSRKMQNILEDRIVNITSSVKKIF